MLFRIITKIDQIEKALEFADGLEIRVDCLNQEDLPKIKGLINSLSIPIMLSLHKPTHGGKFAGSDVDKEAILEKLFSLNPEFVELEHDINPHFLQKMADRFPNVKMICSYYHLHQAPLLFSELFSSIESPFFYAYKFVAFAHSTLDALQMMRFVHQQTQQGKKITGICLGEKGQLASILGPMHGNLFNYIPEEIAGGNVTANELLTIYHYHTLNSKTSDLWADRSNCREEFRALCS